MERSSSSCGSGGGDPTVSNHEQERSERGLRRNFSDSTVHSVSSRGVERGDSLHSLGSQQLPAPKTTRPIQRSTWNSSRNLSERSLLSTTSSIMTAPILEGDDEESFLLAEKLQNEEIIQRVLEQSVTELSFSNSFMSSQPIDPSQLFNHESSPPTNVRSTRQEPPCRGVDLSADLFELDPRNSPPPSKRRGPLENRGSSYHHEQNIEIETSAHSQMSDTNLEPGRQGGRKAPYSTDSSRSLRSISSHNSIGSHQRKSTPALPVAKGALNMTAHSNGSPHSEYRRHIPSAVTSTPNTSQRSLPGAVSVKTPAKVSKTPEVRTAIEKFVSQPIQNPMDQPTVSEHGHGTRDLSEYKPETSDKDGVADQPVLKYKYKPQHDSPDHKEIVLSQTNTDRKEPVWKTVTSSESSHLGHGWPALGPPQEPTLAAKISTEAAAPEVHEQFLKDTADNISLNELRQIEEALRESEKTNNTLDCKPSAAKSEDNDQVDSGLSAEDSQVDHGLSAEDSLAIANALRQAEEEERARREEDERRSLEVALMMQREEDERAHVDLSTSRPNHQGNVRTVSREEFVVQRYKANQSSSKGPMSRDHEDDDDEPDEFVNDGFRMNTVERQKWSRVNRDVVVGPDKTQRTKHDTMLNGKSNAYRLGLEEGLPSISNATYNSFKKSTKAMTKGVATSGVGRAGTDSGGTKSGALDENVRLIARKAINRGFIDKMNGIVNEGKEAVVYHADAGPESENFDVAVKAFKRIQEFRSRGEYVDGDPRYRTKFSNVGAREQLELWAEKEFRNLTRANAAGIAVPFPLWTKENVVFMRFLGNTRPCPQIRELDLHNGSKRWGKLYEMVLDSIQRLYRDARLVHGDLSEYNILVVPTNYIRPIASTEIIPVFIDFAQAVDIRHPEAESFLARDVRQVSKFFEKVGVSIQDPQDFIDGLLNF